MDTNTEIIDRLTAKAALEAGRQALADLERASREIDELLKNRRPELDNIAVLIRQRELQCGE